MIDGHACDSLADSVFNLSNVGASYTFSNGPRRGDRATSLRSETRLSNQNTCDVTSERRLINEHSNAIVAVGSADGTVRLWRGAFDDNASLLTAWSCGQAACTSSIGTLSPSWQYRTPRATSTGQARRFHRRDRRSLQSGTSVQAGAGMSWRPLSHPVTGTMYTAHPALPHIVVWDAGSQKRTPNRLPLDSKGTGVTCLNATKKSDHLLCAVRTHAYRCQCS